MSSLLYVVVCSVLRRISLRRSYYCLEADPTRAGGGRGAQHSHPRDIAVEGAAAQQCGEVGRRRALREAALPGVRVFGLGFEEAYGLQSQLWQEPHTAEGGQTL